MRTKVLVLIGLAALFLSSAEGQTQSGGSGESRGSFGRGRGPRGDWSGSRDPNEFFNRMANGKEIWSKADMDPRVEGFFDRIAERMGVTNGVITRQQYLDYSQQRAAERASRGGFGGPPGGLGGPPPAAPRPSGPPSMSPDNRGGSGSSGGPDAWAERIFRRLDLNGDGYLNYDEMPEALRSERDKWDTDKNGLIDLNEFTAYFQARLQQFQVDRGQSPDQPWSGGAASPYDQAGWNFIPAPVVEEEPKLVVYRPGKLPKELPSWFAQLDTDRDAQIGLYEWKVSGRSLEEFEEIDRNKDGFLTVEEVLRYVAKQKERAGQSPEGQEVNWSNGRDSAYLASARDGAPGRNGGWDGGSGGTWIRSGSSSDNSAGDFGSRGGRGGRRIGGRGSGFGGPWSRDGNSSDSGNGRDFAPRGDFDPWAGRDPRRSWADRDR